MFGGRHLRHGPHFHKNGKAAVTQENSPHHYCSRQGYVDSPAVPIVCLPNETIVTIEGSEAQEDTVIQ
nr:NusG domain II-containing protein [Allobaculum sp. Allo2]